MRRGQSPTRDWQCWSISKQSLKNLKFRTKRAAAAAAAAANLFYSRLAKQSKRTWHNDFLRTIFTPFSCCLNVTHSKVWGKTMALSKTTESLSSDTINMKNDEKGMFIFICIHHSNDLVLCFFRNQLWKGYCITQVLSWFRISNSLTGCLCLRREYSNGISGLASLLLFTPFRFFFSFSLFRFRTRTRLTFDGNDIFQIFVPSYSLSLQPLWY